MNTLLEWARGPVFIFAFTFMVLGLIRHVLITAWETRRTIRQAGDKEIPYAQVFKATLKWLVPIDKLKNEPLFSATSMIFHVAILVAPLFLAAHIALWARGTGMSWPALSNTLIDILTITAVVTAIAIVLQRMAARATRELSRPGDYLLPLIVAVPFATGFLAMHPALNPFSYSATLFVHVMSGNLIFVLMPITKLSHAAMLPGVQLVSEVGWRWPIDSGRKVAEALGKEGDPV